MANKRICPTCNKKIVPKGMHCRECLCDIFANQPIGTMHRWLLDIRNAKRKKTPPKSIAEIYQIT
jgi:hypothetical protein